VVLDACGRFEEQPSVATISRLTQAGVVLVNTRVVVLEAMADNAHPMARDIYATLPAGIVVMERASMPITSARPAESLIQQEPGKR
jgi:hypothetical protein